MVAVATVVAEVVISRMRSGRPKSERISDMKAKKGLVTGDDFGLNRNAGDSYTIVTSSAASTRRSSVGLNAQSLVNQALRGLQSPS